MTILENLKNENIKLFAYSNPESEDDYTKSLKEKFDVFNNIFSISFLGFVSIIIIGLYFSKVVLNLLELFLLIDFYYRIFNYLFLENNFGISYNI